MKASILIRSYNALHTIKRALESALNQDFSKNEFEVIVVDDGSDDGTFECEESYTATNKNLTVLAQPHQGGTPAARLAFSKARGGYVVVLDSDDEFLPNLLKTMTQALDANPSYQFAYPDYYEEYQGKRELVSPKNIFDSVAVGTMFRRVEVQKVGFYRDNLIFSEYDLLLRTMNIWKGRHVAEAVFMYHRSPTSATSDPLYVQKGFNELLHLHPDKIADIKKIRSYELPHFHH